MFNKLELFALVAMASLMDACSAAEQIESHVECGQICDRYSECYDSDYNTEECTNECNASYDEDPKYFEKIDSCEACIDDKSCSEGTFSCADKCIGIVP